jgi:membrane protein DedA with SNARE-associated domain
VDALLIVVPALAGDLDTLVHPFSTMARWCLGSADQQQQLRTTPATPIDRAFHARVNNLWISTVGNVGTAELQRPQGAEPEPENRDAQQRREHVRRWDVGDGDDEDRRDDREPERSPTHRSSSCSARTTVVAAVARPFLDRCATHRLGLVAAVVAATIGSTVGALILYWIARRLGVDRINTLLRRIPLMEQQDLDRARDWFDRHDQPSVLIGRMVPGVRSFISLPAGFQRMPLVPFIALTALGSAVWNTCLVTGGYLLGRQWQSIGAYSDWLNVAVLAALLAAAARFVWNRRERIAGDRADRAQ